MNGVSALGLMGSNEKPEFRLLMLRYMTKAMNLQLAEALCMGVRWVHFIGQLQPLASLTPGRRKRIQSQCRPHWEFCLPVNFAGLYGSTSQEASQDDFSLPAIAVGKARGLRCIFVKISLLGACCRADSKSVSGSLVGADSMAGGRRIAPPPPGGR